MKQIKKIAGDSFVSAADFSIKIDTSVEIALGSRKLNKVTEIPNEEKLVSPCTEKLLRDRQTEIWKSNFDLDYE